MNAEVALVAANERLTAEDIRKYLLNRASQYRDLTGKSFSEIGKAAVNDPAFLSRCEGGRNFTIDVYARLETWLAQNWPSEKGGVTA